MKRLVVRCALVLAALAPAVPAAAQRPGPPPPPPGEHPGRPGMEEDVEGRAFDLLVRRRQALGLTDGQVARLREIHGRLEARNRPLRQRLRQEWERFARERREQMARLTPQQRRDTLRRLREEGGPPRLPENMQPLVREMRENQRAAMDEAQTVLTPEQKVRARRMLRQHRERMMRERPGPGGRRPPRRGGRPGPGGPP